MVQKNMHSQNPQKISFWDHALNWFQIYGKQISIGITLLFLSTILLLFIFTRQSDKRVDESISSNLIADKLLSEPDKLQQPDHAALVEKLIISSDQSSSLSKQYQGLIGQELLLAQRASEAEVYLKQSSAFLNKNGQTLFTQVSTLSQLIANQEWGKAKTLSDSLLALPEFTDIENGTTPFMTYSYILLSRCLIFQKTDNNTELLQTESQLKTILGLAKKGPKGSEEQASKLFTLLQDGSLSFFDICQIIQ